jgi:HSP20 family protein
MKKIRRPFFDDFDRMQDSIDRLFNYMLDERPIMQRGLVPRNNNRLLGNYDFSEPIVDYCETDNEYVTTFEFPGIDKKDIKIDTKNNGIEINIEKKEEVESGKDEEGQFSSKRFFGYKRFFSMPENADLSQVSASFKNGVLELRTKKKLLANEERKQITIS